MNKMKMVLGVLIAAMAGTAPAQAQANFTYSTRGCFGRTCAVDSASALQASYFANPGTLFFTGVSGVTVGPSNSNGFAAAWNLGSFTFSGGPLRSAFDNLTFKLYLDITAPTIADATFRSKLEGSIKRNTVTGELEVGWLRDYSNELPYDSNSTYRIFLRDVDEPGFEPSYTLRGAFDCSPKSTRDGYRTSRFEGGGCGEQPVSIVPEPSLVLLIATGLIGIFGLARWRKRRT